MSGRDTPPGFRPKNPGSSLTPRFPGHYSGYRRPEEARRPPVAESPAGREALRTGGWVLGNFELTTGTGPSQACTRQQPPEHHNEEFRIDKSLTRLKPESSLQMPRHVGNDRDLPVARLMDDDASVPGRRDAPCLGIVRFKRTVIRCPAPPRGDRLMLVHAVAGKRGNGQRAGSARVKAPPLIHIEAIALVVDLNERTLMA